MSDENLQRVREDLETVRQAAGLELPIRREDVWSSWLLVPAGLFLSLYMLFAPINRLHAMIALLPMGAILGWEIWMRYQHRRSTGRSSSRRKEMTFNILMGLIVLAAVIFYRWLAYRMDVPRDMVGATMLFFASVVMLVAGLSAPARRCLLAAAPLVMGYGLLSPLLTDREVAVVGGLFVMIAGAGGALIMQYQLRKAEAHHGAD